MKRQIQEIGLPKSYSKRKFVASFKADPELWSRFKEGCVLRGVSICHVLEALMEAWLQGQKATATVIKPVTVNLTMQHVVQRPRRIQDFEDAIALSRDKNWPPPCRHARKFFIGTKEVGCNRIRDVISLRKCWQCFLYRERT